MHRRRLAAIITAAIFLSACGGGSKDENRVTRINAIKNIEIGESSTKQFEAPSKIKSVKFVSGSENLSLSFSDNQLIASSSELQSPELSTFDVLMRIDSKLIIQRYELLGINTSALLDEEKAYAIDKYYSDILNLSTDREVYNFVVDLAYLKEIISPLDRDKLIGEFSVSDQYSYKMTKLALDDVMYVFNKYQSGQVGENTLAASVAQAEDEISIHGGYGIKKLRAIEDLSLNLFGSLPNNNIEFVSDYGFFSRYFDESMTTINSLTGELSYIEDYRLLTPITGI